jgi:stalled ribosome alternative rescue factor ArfA
MPGKTRKIRRRSGIAAALKFFKPKVVRAKKGRASYRRKAKHSPPAEE